MPPLPASRLLVGGRRLLLLPRLVERIGLNEAIVLQQVRYYLEDERQPRTTDGRRWVRAPLNRWRERDFPFWTTRTIERTFATLAARGLVIARQLDIRGGDATNSYTIEWTNLAALDRDAPRTSPECPGEGSAAGQLDSALPPLPASNYLDEEDLLPIGVQLAALIGLDEAVVLRQIYYWLGDRRRPPVRDGRRWICPPQVPFWESLAFRSRKTIQRVLQELERRGLLISSTGYNTSPRNRTNWYTIDFAVLEGLEGGPSTTGMPLADTEQHTLLPRTQNVAIERPKMSVGDNRSRHVSVTQNVAIDAPEMSRSNNPPDRDGAARVVAMQQPQVAVSLSDRKTDQETPLKTQQQSHEPDTLAEHAVVIVPSIRDDLIHELVAHGITRAIAPRLIAQFGVERVRHHCDVHGWELTTMPDPERLTAGRLRRRIEEDWVVPPGYRTPAERVEQSAARVATTTHAAERARHDASLMAERERERAARLAAVGLTASDQALWSRLVHDAPLLPRLFNSALFFNSTGATPAALLFATPEDVDRAHGVGLRQARAAIAARLARLHGRPVEVRYLWYDDVVRLMAGEPGARSSIHGDDRA